MMSRMKEPIQSVTCRIAPKVVERDALHALRQQGGLTCGLALCCNWLGDLGFCVCCGLHRRSGLAGGSFLGRHHACDERSS